MKTETKIEDQDVKRVVQLIERLFLRAIRSKSWAERKACSWAADAASGFLENNGFSLFFRAPSAGPFVSWERKK